MSLHVFLAMALTFGQASGPELCGDTPIQIEPDMRILESDLGQAAAAAAADKLKIMIDQRAIDGELYYGAMNQLKIIQGHILLQQAQADRARSGADSQEGRQSKMALCQWLGQQGFWYD
jgi:hypothetical protein